MRDLLTEPLALTAISIALGLAIGRLRFGQFSLGSSGALFVGLVLGWMTVVTAGEAEAKRLMLEGVIGTDIFRWPWLCSSVPSPCPLPISG
jgi:putative transport protein